MAEPQIAKHGGYADQLSRKHWGMDRFRVRALEKIIGSGRLGAGDREAAIEMLIRKAGILTAGAEKRGNEERASHYRDLQHQYLLRG